MSHLFQRKDGCPPDCPCYEPKNWRTQTISLTNLEKLDIIQFKGVDHEFDFLKLIFRCAPMLNKVTVELPKGFTPNDDWWTKIHNIFVVYPSVERNIDHSPGKHVSCMITMLLDARWSLQSGYRA